ncbi:MAG: maleylacetate reductase [Candidatus Leucobacter sulfamidivorax]|nr:maleylacetate reductase [Candidatus Leucobacter sulfamidivorax]
MALTFDHTTLGQRLLFGAGVAVEHTATAVAALGAERVLLVADAFAMELSDAIAARVPVIERIHDIVQHVPAARADAATALAASCDADAIVTIGGGSSTGLAKIVALRTGLPIVAVPTTFAGSEATSVWGLTTDQRKDTGSDSRVLPTAIVYDVTLSTGLPAQLAVSSGLNALAHAVDSFWAPRADPINRAMGTEGMNALIPGLRGLAADPADLEARERVLFGAYLAAVAFGSAGSAMHHKICHALGGAFDLPHAELHSIVLPYVAAFNMPAAPEAAARVSAALGGGDAASGLWRLREDLGAPRSLAEIGMREGDIALGAELAFDAIPLSNPRRVQPEELEALIRAAWAGEPV